MTHVRSAFLLSTALLVVAADSSASQCVFRGKTADTRVVRFSGEVLAPESWTTDAQCERLEVVSGTVRVMSQAPSGKVGETEISSGPLLKPEQGVASKLLRQIGIVLAGDEHSRTGMSRAGTDFDLLREAMPTGLLVDRGAPLALRLPNRDGLRGALLVLTPDTGAALKILARDGILLIPAAASRAPMHYRWHFSVPAASAGDRAAVLDGEFSVVTLASFTAALDALKTPSALTDDESALTVASGLIERGYVQEGRARLAAYFLK